MILPSIRIDVLFLGVDALDLATGDPYAQDPEEASVDAALVAAATRTVVLADSSKLGRSAFARICAASDLDQVVTDTGLTARPCRPCGRAGSTCSSCSRPSRAPAGRVRCRRTAGRRVPGWPRPEEAARTRSTTGEKHRQHGHALAPPG